jgi:hypothetical protein
LKINLQGSVPFRGLRQLSFKIGLHRFDSRGTRWGDFVPPGGQKIPHPIKRSQAHALSKSAWHNYCSLTVGDPSSSERLDINLSWRTVMSDNGNRNRNAMIGGGLGVVGLRMGQAALIQRMEPGFQNGILSPLMRSGARSALMSAPPIVKAASGVAIAAGLLATGPTKLVPNLFSTVRDAKAKYWK